MHPPDAIKWSVCDRALPMEVRAGLPRRQEYPCRPALSIALGELVERMCHPGTSRGHLCRFTEDPWLARRGPGPDPIHIAGLGSASRRLPCDKVTQTTVSARGPQADQADVRDWTPSSNQAAREMSIRAQTSSVICSSSETEGSHTEESRFAWAA